jgi:hypothetical protein
MRRDIIKNVEIKEPPLEELTRKYSTFSSIKRNCLGGCGCLLFLIIILILILKFAIGVGPKNLSTVPTDFPVGIPVYDEEQIDSITYISGTYKNRVIEIAALFPKIILTPLISALDKDSTSDNQESSNFKDMWKIINAPVSDRRDVIKIKWKDLNTDPSFLYSYYLTELKKNEYKVTTESKTKNEKQFSFSKDSITGSIHVKSNDENTKTQVANLIVNYFTKK